ncbi:diguanylate cyclase domain-containing protein [Hydrogenimonas sp.]
MSLTKQVGLTVSLLLLLLLGGVLGLYFFKSKSFYETKLSRDADEIAHTITLAIEPDIEDLNRTKAIVDAAFSSGLYTRILLKDMKTGYVIYERKKHENLSEVPHWFVQALPIHVPDAEEVIEADHDIFAKLTVTPDRAPLYRQLFDLFVYTAGLFVLFGILGLLAISLLLKKLHLYLEKIRQQAEGVIHNRFIVQKELPPASELKNVVVAMNSMVKRVKELYNHSSETMRQSREMLYIDTVTGLYNRRYFQLKLPEYLLANDSRSAGVLMMIRLDGVIESNRKIGHKKMDEFFVSFASILKESCQQVYEPLVCRLNGTEFALMLPGHNAITAEDLGRSIVGKNILLTERYGLRNLLQTVVGACEYRRKMQPARLLGCVDSALSAAAVYDENRVVCYAEDRKAASKEEWRRLITAALKEGRLQPRFTAVYDTKRHRDVTHTLTFDIVTEEKVFRYGDYLPAVVELGMEMEVMNYIFHYLQTHRFVQKPIAFEMIAEMLHESDKLFLFEEHVDRVAKNVGTPLFVEISEHDILSLAPIVVERLSMNLERRGVRIGIDRFNGEKGDYGYLKYTAPAYVKMEERSFLDLDGRGKNALFTMLASLDIQLVLYNVHGENIPELQENGVRYIVYAE